MVQEANKTWDSDQHTQKQHGTRTKALLDKQETINNNSKNCEQQQPLAYQRNGMRNTSVLMQASEQVQQRL